MIESLVVTQTGTLERKDAQANVKDVLCCVHSPCIVNAYISNDGDGLIANRSTLIVRVAQNHDL